MAMLIVNDVLNVRRGMMRVGSSAKLLGFCCQEAGAGAVGWGGCGASCFGLGLAGSMIRQTLGGPG